MQDDNVEWDILLGDGESLSRLIFFNDTKMLLYFMLLLLLFEFVKFRGYLRWNYTKIPRFAVLLILFLRMI